MREALLGLIRSVPDFPRPGILFRDITPLLGDPGGLREAVEAMAAPWAGRGVDLVAGIESRGFLLGVPLALRLGVGFVPVRKPGKLPARTLGEDYDLEYGTDRVEMHADAVKEGQRVLLVDDLLATGGTAAASVALLRRAGARVEGIGVLIELQDLEGRRRLPDLEVRALLSF